MADNEDKKQETQENSPKKTTSKAKASNSTAKKQGGSNSSSRRRSAPAKKAAQATQTTADAPVAAPAPAPAEAPATSGSADAVAKTPAKTGAKASTETAAGKAANTAAKAQAKPKKTTTPARKADKAPKTPAPTKAKATEPKAEVPATAPAPEAPASAPAQEASKDAGTPAPKKSSSRRRSSRRKSSTPKPAAAEAESAAPSEAPEVVAASAAPSAPASTAASADGQATAAAGAESVAPAGEQAAPEKSDSKAPSQKPKRSGGRSGGKSSGKSGGKTAGKGQKTPPDAASETASDTPAEQTADTAAGKPSEKEPAKKQPQKGQQKQAKGKYRMFFSMLGGEQIEVAMACEGQLVEYYLDMLHQRKMKGNIYKGVIHNIDTNLQAAFVDFGAGKNGFLQIDEVHPEYWQAHHEPAKGKRFPPIQKVLKAGQELLVQVVKEPTGNKGAFLTTWLSLAGRFLVLTPGQEQLGVSRKVEDDAERARLKELVTGIEPGDGMGVIVRTVSAGTTKTNLKNDLQYLKRLWKDIRKKATEVSAPSLVHKEPGLAERAVRDYFTDEVGEVWVDNHELAATVRGMTELLFPRKTNLVHEHSDAKLSLWDRFNLRRQIEQIHAREVTLPSGGRLVFDQTEALMAIDINSGKISGKSNFAAMAHKTNKEAAEVIASQLRLRDVGGQVVIDFIEMRDSKHVQDVEKTLRQAMKNDRARHEINHMSSFGLLELVRQRTGSSAISITLEPCPHCGGTGQRRNMEWQALQAVGELRRQLQNCKQDVCAFPLEQELAIYVLNRKRDLLQKLESEFGKAIEISIKV